jgi:hypothetical protein
MEMGIRRRSPDETGVRVAATVDSPDDVWPWLIHQIDRRGFRRDSIRFEAARVFCSGDDDSDPTCYHEVCISGRA